MMDKDWIDAEELGFLSKLFCYPERIPEPSETERVGSSWGKDCGEDNLAALQKEYVRLFINALPEVPCSPYGSVYLEGFVMGESTVRLKNLYQRYGFVTEEMPDHIAVELEFLAMLSLLGLEEAVEEDRRFLLDHLRHWTAEFFSRVEQSDETGFYRDLSRNARKVLNPQSLGKLV